MFVIQPAAASHLRNEKINILDHVAKINVLPYKNIRQPQEIIDEHEFHNVMSASEEDVRALDPECEWEYELEIESESENISDNNSGDNSDYDTDLESSSECSDTDVSPLFKF